MTGRNKILTAALMCSVAGFAFPAAAESPATMERLTNSDSEPQNWLIPFGNYSAHRYSGLDEINASNVGGLRVAFTVPMNQAILSGQPRGDNQAAGLVDDGIMYIDAKSGFAMKIDMTSGDYGRVVWVADASSESARRTRGGALYEDSYVTSTDDGRIVRIDRGSGEIIYDSQIARVPDAGHSGIELESDGFNVNPLVADGIIEIGNSRGDAGTRGWVAGVDFETGEQLWRFYTVPGPGEFGHETWADEAGVSWKTGGAAIWTGWSYDVAQQLFIGGTAQPVPMFDPEYRPGDNLFSNSVLALTHDTGELAWFYQYTPNESWDYDEQGVHILIDAPFAGDDRQMVTHFGRNGFYYQVDRTNGEFISGTQYVSEITWTAGLDPKTGKPVEYDPNLTLQTYIPETRWARADTAPKTACPYLPGGVRWQPPTYNPDTQIAYVGGEDGCQRFMILSAVTLANGEIDEQGRRVPGTRGDTEKGGLLAAVDVTTGELLGSVVDDYPNRSGALSTAGGLVMAAWYDGRLAAYDATTLEELWDFHTGIAVKAPWTSFEINGKQYLAIVAGERQPADDRLGVERGIGVMLYVFTL